MTAVPPKLKVLVVDNERLIADSLVLILKQNGCDATAAYSGEESVRLAAALAPDVLISDVIMGAMNGIAAALTIRAAHPACDILLVSGNHSTGALLEQARAAGHHFEALAKPVHPRWLLQRLGLSQTGMPLGPDPL
ncbi:response regulator [Acidobacteria bacterium AB60]|nr:response regulator [Acidobacteria bacterium AB60]